MTILLDILAIVGLVVVVAVLAGIIVLSYWVDKAEEARREEERLRQEAMSAPLWHHTCHGCPGQCRDECAATEAARRLLRDAGIEL